MARIQIDLPEPLKAKAEARAAASGHESLEGYVQSLIEADADGEDLGTPDHLKVQDDAQLEQFISQRVNDPRPSVEATPEFWQKLLERAKHDRGDTA
jgi:hypothetical protein